MSKSHRQSELSSALAIFCVARVSGQLSGSDHYVEAEHQVGFTCLFRASDVLLDSLRQKHDEPLPAHEGQIYVEVLILPLTPSTITATEAPATLALIFINILHIYIFIR